MLCHSVGRGGSETGPNLSGVGSQPPRHLLESLVNPGAVVTPGYGVVSVTLQHGETIGGTLLAEDTGATTIKLADGTTRAISQTEIVSKTPVASLMPPVGLVLSKRELRDLLAYLQTL
jgi:quinoprotein glucose dehydrogenase